jgi:hypothetical protein
MVSRYQDSALSLVRMAEDARFELARGCPQHASNTAHPCSPLTGTVRKLCERDSDGRQRMMADSSE